MEARVARRRRASRLASGSSMRKATGRRTIARPSAACWRSPSESSRGRRPSSSPMPRRPGGAPDAIAARRVRLPAQLEREAHVPLHGEVRIERGGLEHHGHLPLARRDVVDHAVADADRALGRPVQARHQAQHGRLAAAGRAEEDAELAVADAQVEVVDGGRPVREDQADVLEGDAGHDGTRLVCGLEMAVPLPNVVEVRRTFPRPRIDDIDAAVREQWDKEGIGVVRPPRHGGRDRRRQPRDRRASRRSCGRSRAACATPARRPSSSRRWAATAARRPRGRWRSCAASASRRTSATRPSARRWRSWSSARRRAGRPSSSTATRTARTASSRSRASRRTPTSAARVESGLLKMCAIGLGKHAQALALHALGVAGIRDHMVDAGLQVAGSGHVLFGLAIVENAYDEAAIVEAVPPPDFLEREASLLETSKGWLPRLPVDDVDVLVVDRMGKNYSGTGMDTNVLGRFRIPGEEEPAVAARALRRRERPDRRSRTATPPASASPTSPRSASSGASTAGATYENVLTSTFVERGKIPIACAHDRAAVERRRPLHLGRPVRAHPPRADPEHAAPRARPGGRAARRGGARARGRRGRRRPVPAPVRARRPPRCRSARARTTGRAAGRGTRSTGRRRRAPRPTLNKGRR